jgi:hypothetical protein
MTPPLTIKDMRRIEMTNKERMRNEGEMVRRRSAWAGTWVAVLEADEDLLRGVLMTKTTSVVIEDILDRGAGVG